jgi:predicted nuclease of predicted toxin-antitoxin system
MRFLIDAQLPPALARWLSAEGHESIHVMDMEMQASSDRVIWDFAVQSNFIIVTKDKDFAQRKIMAKKGPCVCGFAGRIRVVPTSLIASPSFSRPSSPGWSAARP